MMRTSSFFYSIAIVLLCLNTGAANASPSMTAFDSSGNAVFSDTGLGSSFADIFSFSLPSSATSGSSIASGINAGGLGVLFNMFNLYENSNLIGSGATGGSSSSISNFIISNASDTFTLDVKGTNSGGSSSGYSGIISVSPVPEPETYAMLLAGLGLVAFTARRRKTN